MPDICMCQLINCPKSESCYRFKAKPNDIYQPYQDFTFECLEKNYQWYWPMRENVDVVKSEGVE